MAYGRFAFVYDRLMADMPYPEWVTFTQECFGRLGATPQTIAELGCGTGSITIPLARLGYTVYGIDLSDEMLAVALEKQEGDRRASPPGQPGGSLVWLQQDMREWELDIQVDAVLSYCDCINYLTELEDVQQVFYRTWQGLKPGGIFSFDVHTYKTLEQYAEYQPYTYNEPDLAYIWESALEEDEGIIQHDLTFFMKDPVEGGKYERFEEQHIQRAYSLKELKRMLEEAGFEQVACYADFGWEEADESAQRAFFVAVKPEQ